jgi:transcriptional regulator with XRE-family HTH domain
VSERAAQPPVFAQRLAQARKRAGLTQVELGVQVGMEPAVASARINQYERGKHEPKLETAKRLAEALGIPAAFLYTGDALLAELLLQWNDLTVREKKALLKQLPGGKATLDRRRHPSV